MQVRRAVRRLRRFAFGAALAVSSALILAPPGNAQPAPAADPAPVPQLVPISVADIAAPLLDAVVNISVTQTLAINDPANLPENFPFQDLFGGNGEPLQRIQGLGSGFVIDPAGVIVTNVHVIEGADEIWATFHDGTRLAATIIGTDPQTDIAVLRVEPPAPLVAVPFGDSEALRIGDWVIAIGNPFGLGGSVTLGIISARNRDLNAGPLDDYLQTDTAINTGNSGGPLFNLAGEVIGVNTAIFSETGASAGVAFAVPSAMVARVVSQIVEFGAVRRGRIGVRIQEITPGIAEGFGLAQARGALVVQTFEGTPAEEVGLQVGDIIIRLGNRDVIEMRDLPLIVANTDVGAELPITFIRGGAEQTVTVTIQEVAPEPGAIVTDGPPPAPQTPAVERTPLSARDLGLTLAPISPEARREFDIAAAIDVGVVITAVAPGSFADERGIVAGEIIIEVGPDALLPPVADETDVNARLAEAQSGDRNVVLLLLSDPMGTTRFEWVRVGP